jgi:ATP-dependent Clp protease ATP-binding subunit ClpC
MLFVGPTGVGKTEAAKILCRYLLGDERKLIRFDMNEYLDAYSVNRLLGDYHQAEGLLASSVRNKPFGVLLFDEIEKAHNKVQDLLLQVLDEGVFSNTLGKKIDLKNYVIIMTSNLGSEEINRRFGYETENSSNEQIYKKAIENNFRPEFVNRIEEIVIFNSLSFDNILEIARLQIVQLFSREGFMRRTTILNISQEVLHWVAKRGFNSKMGGRALKRQIEKDLTLFAAEKVQALPLSYSILI